jgi:glycosyltransferase involved in cell wall biosynthesis
LKNFEVICNGIMPVEENSFERVPISSDAPSRVPYLVMLGTFEPRKGHAFLLSAYKSLLALGCSIELRIYGEGTKAQRDEMLLQIRNLDLDGKVFLENFSNKPREIIQNVEVLLIPSQSYESFGLTAIEAMAVGTPVVSTGVGGLPEVLKNGGGIICEQENPLIFADAINRILHDPSLRESIGLSGQSSFKQHFTAEIMSSKYHSLMENLC